MEALASTTRNLSVDEMVPMVMKAGETAVSVMALLALGFKGIRLGPTLPGFLSPQVVKVLVKKFTIKPITPVEEDVQAIMTGN